MKTSTVVVYDPTVNDSLSKVRGVGRYLQILKENFPDWTFSNKVTMEQWNNETIFINPFFNFLKRPLLMRRIAKKEIAVIHDLIPLKYPSHFPLGVKGKFNFLLNQFALNNYDVIITDSEASKKDIVEILHIKPDKVRVVYPCLPKIFTENKSEIRNPRFAARRAKSEANLNSNFDIRASNFCLYVGDATWNKNIVNLAKAIKKINVTCVFVGKVFEMINDQSLIINNQNPWNRELNEFIRVIDSDKHFVFPGFVEDSQLIELYRKARCHVLVSRDEGFGFPYLEAASQSCPSILSDIPVLREIASNSAVFVNLDDIYDIAHQISGFSGDTKLRETVGNKAHIQFETFTSAKFKSVMNLILTAL